MESPVVHWRLRSRFATSSIHEGVLHALRPSGRLPEVFTRADPAAAPAVGSFGAFAGARAPVAEGRGGDLADFAWELLGRRADLAAPDASARPWGPLAGLHELGLGEPDREAVESREGWDAGVPALPWARRTGSLAPGVGPKGRWFKSSRPDCPESRLLSGFSISRELVPAARSAVCASPAAFKVLGRGLREEPLSGRPGLGNASDQNERASPASEFPSVRRKLGQELAGGPRLTFK
jgi:hypothetical protein